MSSQSEVKDPQLERQGRRLGKPGKWWLLVGLVIAIPGIVLLVVGLTADQRTLWVVGVAVLVIGSIPATVGVALLVSGAVARRAARHKLFA